MFRKLKGSPLCVQGWSEKGCFQRQVFKVLVVLEIAVFIYMVYMRVKLYGQGIQCTSTHIESPTPNCTIPEGHSARVFM